MSEREPVDPDVDLHVAAQRSELRPHGWPVLGAISAGGALGALARYQIGLLIPHRGGEFPWATFGINVAGCFLIGVLMVLLGRFWPGSRLIRPFFGVGILGGFTTFSTYVVDIQKLIQAGASGTALVYLVGTVVAALLAVWAGGALTRRLAR